MRDVDLLIDKDKATVRGQAVEMLRMAIVSGRFQPGQRLIERELCQLLGVGRTSVREAVRQMEAEGLLIGVPHRGMEVNRITIEDAEQLYTLRALLEGFSGRCCAQTASPEFMDAFDEAVEVFAKAAHQVGSAEMIRAKAVIYDLLMSGSGNSFVRQTLTSMHNRINLLRFTSMAQQGRPERSVAEIREIARAIRAQDPDRAERACRRHIEEAAKVAIECLKNGPMQEIPD